MLIRGKRSISSFAVVLPHSKLLALGGAYYRLWKMQAGGFLPEEASHQNLPDVKIEV